MRLYHIPFEAIDWSTIEESEHPGVIGVARWRTRQFGDVRVRMVEYSPGYVANHWCQKGHVVLCLEGEIHTELEDGRVVILKPGMSYQVGDGEQPHRSRTANGAKLFIVD